MVRTATATTAVLALAALLTAALGQQPGARLGQPIADNPPAAAVQHAEPAPQPKTAAATPTIPISLPVALQLAKARPLDIEIAQQRLAVAVAQLQRAEALWLPTIYIGGDYFRHDGQLQDVTGNVFGTSKSNMMLGAGPSAVFATTDALFGPLAARQDVRARDAAVQTARNDSLLAVAEAYFNVQQARGEILGAELVVRHAEELVRRTEKLAPKLVPPVEALRAKAELAKRRQDLSKAREKWRVASAELCRVLRLDTGLPVEPVEPPFLQITLLPTDSPVDELIPVALTTRPELAGQQAVVQAALQRLRAEKLRPLMPSVLLRGGSTNVTGTLAGGYFGGGINDRVGDGGARMDFDLQILWEWQNLGFGNRAKVREKTAEHQLAIIELFRLQDRIAAEVVQAQAQVQESAARVQDAEAGLKYAAESLQKNFEGLSKTVQLGGEVVVLVVRPQEVVAAVQALGQANNDYFAAVADYDRAQYRLYRALGEPANVGR
jgi:outer membrane protein TolC